MSVWRVGNTWHYHFQYLGVRYHASTGLAATERNRTRAQEKEFKAKQLVREGNAHLLKLRPMPFSSAAEQFIEWAKGKHRDTPNTWKRLQASTSSLREFFKQKPIHLVNEGSIQDYMTWRRQEKVMEVTLRHDLHCLRPLFRFAMKHRWAMHNPSERVDTPSDKDSQVMRIVTAAEEKSYFAAAAVFPDLHDLGRLILLQGARPWSEVIVARAQDIDLEAGTWLIPKTKSRAGRRVLYLTPESKSILARRVQAANKDGVLFPARNGAQMRTLGKAHDKALEACGLTAQGTGPGTAFRLYDLRHTAATRWHEKGMDIALIAKILGHRDLKTVMRYVHIGNEQAQKAMAQYGQQPEDVKTEAVH